MCYIHSLWICGSFSFKLGQCGYLSYVNLFFFFWQAFRSAKNHTFGDEQHTSKIVILARKVFGSFQKTHAETHCLVITAQDNTIKEG